MPPAIRCPATTLRLPDGSPCPSAGRAPCLPPPRRWGGGDRL